MKACAPKKPTKNKTILYGDKFTQNYNEYRINEKRKKIIKRILSLSVDY